MISSNSWSHFVQYMSDSVNITFMCTGINPEFATRNLKNIFEESWKNKLFDDDRQQGYGNKLRTYRKFKTIFSKEAYLNTIKSFETRKQLCNFRVSNHKLQIETGRHNNIALENRLCDQCHVLEDELHFLIECSKYNTQREELFNIVSNSCQIFSTLSNENKMIYLMSCENENIIKEVGDFIHKNIRT